MSTAVSLYPKHKDDSLEELEAAIVKYREWLDNHGDYGRLYMLDQSKVKSDGTLSHQSAISGIKIFDPEVAMLFRLTHEL
jgi:hypothetical protein